MLMSYKYNNFLSFREDAELTLFAANTKVKKRFSNNYVELPNGYHVLKDAVIVGENAGGKSNFVRSIQYFLSFFISSDRASSSKSTINNNNINGKCPIKSESNQRFEIELTADGSNIYKYLLHVDFLGIVEEKLEMKEKKTAVYKPIMRLIRTDNKFMCESFSDSCEKEECNLKGSMSYDMTIPGMNKEIQKSLEKTIDEDGSLGLFVTKIALLGNKAAVDFINIVKNNICPETNPLNYDLYLSIKKEVDYNEILHTKEFFNIFRMVDYSICDIKIDEEKPFIETIVYRKNKNGDIFSRKIGADSSGVREFFAWAIQIYRVVYENKVVIADEMDRVLNPILSDRVIAFINGKSHYGQFIFTSHNVLHLDLKNYMKEQIYFVSKDVETLESELYSLADFPDVRYETTKVYEFYMKGILGGTAIE
ncbi:MAG: ATP-binding protein [Lachnospiraceae bacterium]|nr:ATP-binding protein [Candidatus Merdinaster equi]